MRYGPAMPDGSRPTGRKRALMRALPLALAGTLLILLVSVDAAWSHAVVRPGASRPAELQAYTLTVPNEKSSPTVAVAMQVPPDIDFILVKPVSGWEVKLERAGGRISVVRWTGGTIARDAYQDFEFIARNPVSEGTIQWKVVQRYATGAPVRWVAPPDSDTPAAETRLSEQVVPEDVVDVEGGQAGGSEASSTTATSSSESTDDGSDAGLIVAIVALVTALGALAVTLLRGRKKAT